MIAESVGGSALRAVLAAPDLASAQAAARDGLDRIAAEAPCNLLTMREAVEITRRTPSTVRRWAAAHHLGRRIGGEWILFRDRFDAFIAGARY